MGDPAGIGPEIIAKAWLRLRFEGPAFLVTGDADLLAACPSAPGLEVQPISSPDEARACFSSALPVLHRPVGAEVHPGQPTPAHAPAVIGWIEMASDLALRGEAGGVVTAPIAKAPLYEAGFRFPGHTEFLGELTRPQNHEQPPGPLMMLAAPGLRTTLVTIHEALSEVPGLLSVERIVEAGLITAHALERDFGVARPRVAVAALNPHGGEAGAFGREEAEIITPACEALRAQGVDCSGPRPADSLFHEAARATYDAVVCMYHDQALIPVKMLDFWGGVNLTLGLPIVRASPDHGVGYDIAGRGIARPDSLIAALRMAGEIAARRAALTPA
jgi:4-hydroxythreonine-4-phosphate dehydrogenase